MIRRDSIKFKLILVTSSIILALMCLLLGFQLHNALATESDLRERGVSELQRYSREQADLLRARLAQDTELLIEMMAAAMSPELYDLNDASIQDKARRLLGNDNICAVTVLDGITQAAIAKVGKEGMAECIPRAVDILHRGETIGRLEVRYSLASAQQMAEQAETMLLNAEDRLHREVAALTRRSLAIQVVLYVAATAILLSLIVSRINRSIIRPMYTLMQDMRLLRRNESASVEMKDRVYDTDELGQLSQYFYDHITTLIGELKRRANHDELTGLLSRQRLIEDLAAGGRLSLAILDIDRFKEINNLLGTEAGDRVLVETAGLLRSDLGTGQSVYRLNADEFAILERPSLGLDRFESRIRALVDRLARSELSVMGELVGVTISAGIADDKESRPMVAATTALKFAKERRLKVARYRHNLPVLKEYEHNLRMTKIVRDAIDEDRVIAVFQPIEDLRTGSVSKYEALMRIKDRDGKLYAPQEFLDIAKKAGTYRDLSDLMIRRSFDCLAEQGLVLTINLSILDIEDERLFGLLDLLSRRGPVLERIVFEITEQEQVTQSDALQAFVARVKKQGARIAVDDFGSGYSNFESLVHLDIDYLKVDGSLIRNLMDDRSSEIVLETIIAFAKKLGIKTIAEFVTNEAIYRKVRAMGVDFAQGYFVGRPGPDLGPVSQGAPRDPIKLAG